MTIAKASQYILTHYKNISPLKLQKLLYYLKVWGIVSSEYSIEGDFVKWTYGPVNEVVYNAYKQYGDKVIPTIEQNGITLPAHQEEVIKFVLDCYLPYDAITLSAMTHEDEPWKNTSLKKVIPEKAIALFYSKTPFAKNFPFNPEKTFYPVQSDLHYAFIFDMTKKEGAQFSSYKSYNDYAAKIKIQKQKVSQLLSEFWKDNVISMQGLNQ
jgi:uncharacterized phage-associated protein